MGRTGRHRRRRAVAGVSREKHAHVTAARRLAGLSTWLRDQGVDCETSTANHDKAVKPHVFVTADGQCSAGMMAVRCLGPRHTLASVPRRLLITSSVALSCAAIVSVLRRLAAPVSAQLLLALFLLHVQYSRDASVWWTYVRCLPERYSTPLYLHSDEVNDRLLPAPLLADVRRRRRALLRQYCCVRRVLLSGEWAHEMVTMAALRHAWTTVDTRAIYNPPSSPQSSLSHRKVYVPLVDDNCALAPYLDLFNHSATACSRLVLRSSTVSIVNDDDAPPTAAGHQAFISYGALDSRRLLLNYGFVPDGGTQHDVVPVWWQHVPLSAAALRHCVQLGVVAARHWDGHLPLVAAVDVCDGVSWQLAACVHVSLTDCGGGEVWRMSVKQLLQSPIVRQRLAQLLAAVFVDVLACWRRSWQRVDAVRRSSSCLRQCAALLSVWRDILAGYVRQCSAHNTAATSYDVRLCPDLPSVVVSLARPEH